MQLSAGDAITIPLNEVIAIHSVEMPSSAVPKGGKVTLQVFGAGDVLTLCTLTPASLSATLNLPLQEGCQLALVSTHEMKVPVQMKVTKSFQADLVARPLKPTSPFAMELKRKAGAADEAAPAPTVGEKRPREVTGPAAGPQSDAADAAAAAAAAADAATAKKSKAQKKKADKESFAAKRVETKKADKFATPVAPGCNTLDMTQKIKIEDLVVGTGKTKVVKDHRVEVMYTGWLPSGKQFDSNTGGKAFKFVVGAGTVIAGWDEGLVGMQEGGRRQLIVPPHLGYGEEDMGAIPPSSWLHFDIRLVKVHGLKVTKETQAQRVSQSEAKSAGMGKKSDKVADEAADGDDDKNEYVGFEKVGALKYKDLEVGVGMDAMPGQTIEVHFMATDVKTGKLIDQTSGSRGFKFTLGQRKMCAGWDLGIKGMKESGLRRLIVPPKLGFTRSQAMTSGYPVSTTIQFDIELKKIHFGTKARR